MGVGFFHIKINICRLLSNFAASCKALRTKKLDAGGSFLCNYMIYAGFCVESVGETGGEKSDGFAEKR